MPSMIKTVKLIGNEKFKKYTKFVKEDCIYYYPSKAGSIDIDIKNNIINIDSINLRVELDDSRNVIYTSENVSFEFEDTDKMDALGEFRDVEEKNSFMKFFLLGIIKYIFFNLYFKIFIDVPLWGISYVQSEPLGIKQNAIIKEFLGLVCKKTIVIQEMLFIPLSVFNLEKMSLKICTSFIFLLCRTVLNRVIDIAELFNNKTYNSLKKRYDNVKLSIDQIIMSVLFFSISFLTLINLIFYYLLYSFFDLMIRLVECLEKSFIFLFVDTSDVGYFDTDSCVYRDVSFSTKFGLIYQYFK